MVVCEIILWKKRELFLIKKISWSEKKMVIFQKHYFVAITLTRKQNLYSTHFKRFFVVVYFVLKLFKSLIVYKSIKIISVIFKCVVSIIKH